MNYHHHTTTVLRPFFQDHPGEPVTEENFWTSWCKGRLTEADTQAIRLGATPSGLTNAHLHHPQMILPIYSNKLIKNKISHMISVSELRTWGIFSGSHDNDVGWWQASRSSVPSMKKVMESGAMSLPHSVNSSSNLLTRFLHSFHIPHMHTPKDTHKSPA